MVTGLPNGALVECCDNIFLKFLTPDAAKVFIGPADIALTRILSDPIEAARNLVLASKLALAKPMTL